MKLILLTALLSTIGVLEASSTYRQYGPGNQPPDAAAMACAMAIHQGRTTCGDQAINSIMNAELTPRQIYNKVLQTSLTELCRPALQFYRCITSQLAVCSGVTHPMATETKKIIDIAGVALKFVCEKKVALFERHKACLLREAGGQSQSIHAVPQVTLAFSIAGSCAPSTPFNTMQPFCIPRQTKTCAKQLIANQCGNKIAKTLEELVNQVSAAANCPTSLVRSLSNSLQNADYSTYKRILDTMSLF